MEVLNREALLYLYRCVWAGAGFLIVWFYDHVLGKSGQLLSLIIAMVDSVLYCRICACFMFANLLIVNIGKTSKLQLIDTKTFLQYFPTFNLGLLVSLIPRPILSFQCCMPAFQCATLKSWKWAWGRGYLLCIGEIFLQVVSNNNYCVVPLPCIVLLQVSDFLYGDQQVNYEMTNHDSIVQQAV